MNLPLVQIAAGFLVAIGACASLIANARATHETLSRLFRATCAEWRTTADPVRKASLTTQAGLFRDRYRHIQDVQSKLFTAIRSLVWAFLVFVLLIITAGADAYSARWEPAAQQWVQRVSIGLGLVIAGFFVHGLCLMLQASRGQMEELKASQETLDLEGQDVFRQPGRAVRIHVHGTIG